MEPSSQPQQHSGEISREHTVTASFTLLSVALSHDRAELTREILLWQRWLRYVAILTITAGVMLFGLWTDKLSLWAPSVTSAALYIAFNILISWHLKRRADETAPTWLPAVIMLADIAVVTALIYLSSTPAQYHRILLLGFLILQLTVFYFGRAQGVWAASLTVMVYVVASMFAPPYQVGPPPTLTVLSFNALLFLAVAAVVVRIFGSFHERLNHLRIFLKRAEAGDLAGSYDAESDRRPDDLTLLGRSFNEVRGRLIELIGTDALTGCLNRRALETRLSREWRQAKRRNATLAVLAIDVDHFKQINDTHGHPVGDQVLQELGEIMRRTARETDTVARLGGDEFVVLLPDTGWQGAMTFAERLRRNVDDHQFGEGPVYIPITVSVGVALARGTDPIAPEALLEASDRSLYKAKSGGRNRICA